MKNKIYTVCLCIFVLMIAVSCSSKELKTPDWLQGSWKNTTNENEVVDITADNIVITTYGSVSLDIKALMATYENASLDQKNSKTSYNLTVINKESGMGMPIGFSLNEDTGILNLTLSGRTYTYSK